MKRIELSKLLWSLKLLWELKGDHVECANRNNLQDQDFHATFTKGADNTLGFSVEHWLITVLLKIPAHCSRSDQIGENICMELAGKSLFETRLGSAARNKLFEFYQLQTM
jgi:hypothetical protein